MGPLAPIHGGTGLITRDQAPDQGQGRDWGQSLYGDQASWTVPVGAFQWIGPIQADLDPGGFKRGAPLPPLQSPPIFFPNFWPAWCSPEASPGDAPWRATRASVARHRPYARRARATPPDQVTEEMSKTDTPVKRSFFPAFPQVRHAVI